MQDIIDRRATRFARDMTVAAVTLGVLARCWHLLRTPLWLDEAYSRFAAEQGWWFLWHVVPRYETHPPFFYSLLHVWQAIAGDSLLAYRLPGLICGLATIVAAGLAAGVLADRMQAAPRERTLMICFAASFCALCPMLLDMSRQVRPYPIMILVYAVAIVALLKLAGIADARTRLARRWIALFFVAEALMLWLHALGPLFGLAMSLALAICVARPTLSRTDWLWLAAGQISAGLLYLPAFAILVVQMPGWVHSTWLIFKPDTVPDQLIGTYVGPWRLLGLYAGFAFLGGMVQFLRLRRQYRIAIALLVLAILPVLLSLLLSWRVSPVFLPRTLSPVVIPFALGIAMLGLNQRPRGIAPGLIAILLAFSGWYDLNYASWLPPEDWTAAADWIAPRIVRGDAVWAYPNETALPLGYALADQRRTLPIRQIPAEVPALGVPGGHPTGTAGVVALRSDDVARIATDPMTAKTRAIWLVGLAAERIDPNDALLRALLRDRTIGRRYRDNEIRILELVAKAPAPTPGRDAPAGATAAR